MKGHVRAAGAALLPLRFFEWDYATCLADAGELFAFDAHDPPKVETRSVAVAGGEAIKWD